MTENSFFNMDFENNNYESFSQNSQIENFIFNNTLQNSNTADFNFNIADLESSELLNNINFDNKQQNFNLNSFKLSLTPVQNKQTTSLIQSTPIANSNNDDNFSFTNQFSHAKPQQNNQTHQVSNSFIDNINLSPCNSQYNDENKMETIKFDSDFDDFLEKGGFIQSKKSNFKMDKVNTQDFNDLYEENEKNDSVESDIENKLRQAQRIIFGEREKGVYKKEEKEVKEIKEVNEPKEVKDKKGNVFKQQQLPVQKQISKNKKLSFFKNKQKKLKPSLESVDEDEDENYDVDKLSNHSNKQISSSNKLNMTNNNTTTSATPTNISTSMINTSTIKDMNQDEKKNLLNTYHQAISYYEEINKSSEKYKNLNKTLIQILSSDANLYKKSEELDEKIHFLIVEYNSLCSLYQKIYMNYMTEFYEKYSKIEEETDDLFKKVNSFLISYDK